MAMAEDSARLWGPQQPEALGRGPGEHRRVERDQGQQVQ